MKLLKEGQNMIGFLIGAGVMFAALWFTGLVDVNAAKSLGDRIKRKFHL